MSTGKKTIFKGMRSRGMYPHVTVNDERLDPRNDLSNHSPDGVNWGYGGSGPSQLALAILAHMYGDHFALNNYMQFKFDVIAKITDDKWIISSDQIDQWFDQRHEK